ncbi:MAG: hypothetical protein KKA70_14110 [Proteobacteria bacterium]|nr:hypothetical protein [Pseudomonadota bacterium]
MNGEKYKISLVFWVLFWQLFLAGLALGDTGTIAVLLSDQEKVYRAPVEIFVDEIGMPVGIYNLDGDIRKAPQVMAEIFSANPSLIFALGAKAAFIAKTWTRDRQDIPVIFAMVLNWERYGLLTGQKNIAGIAHDVALSTQLANLTMFSSDIQNVGVIYSEEYSKDSITNAQLAAKKLGINLISMPITRPHDFKRNFKQLSDKIDAYLVLADPVIYTLDNISWLEKRCVRDRIICIGPSKNVASQGVMLALDPDVKNTGSQAVSIAKNIIVLKKDPQDIGVMPPLGTRLYLNLKTAAKIGFEVSPAVVDLATEIIE